jgi:hypothetical protein
MNRNGEREEQSREKKDGRTRENGAKGMPKGPKATSGARRREGKARTGKINTDETEEVVETKGNAGATRRPTGRGKHTSR